MTDIYKFWKIAENLKKETRWNGEPWGIIGADKFGNIISDNVAAHSYSVGLLAMLIIEYYKIVDMDIAKIYKMITVHDLPEAIAGDTDAYEALKNPELKISKHQKELDALNLMTGYLPDEIKKSLRDIWNEYEEQKTNESKFVKLCDRLETISQMINADISKDEYDYIKAGAEYGLKELSQHPKYKEIINIFKEKQKENFVKQGFDWNSDYDVKFN